MTYFNSVWVLAKQVKKARKNLRVFDLCSYTVYDSTSFLGFGFCMKFWFSSF
jgi:hypothetical protein